MSEITRRILWGAAVAAGLALFVVANIVAVYR